MVLIIMERNLVFLVAIFLHVLGGCTWQSVPESDFLRDDGGLLTEVERNQIKTYHKALLDGTGIHFYLVLSKEIIDDIDGRAAALVEKFKIGEKGKGGQGLLFLIDPQGKQVRLEVGYSLEPIYTDAFVGYVEREQMKPFFEMGRVSHGVLATVELLVTRALKSGVEPSNMNSDTKDDFQHLSGGAGAKMEVAIGSKGLVKKEPHYHIPYQPQPTPEGTLLEYMNILREQNKNPSLEIYTDETKDFLKTWLVTDAQQKSELDTLQKLQDQAQRFENGDRAVLRFPLANRMVPPYFFRWDEDGWKIDLVSLSKSVRFNHLNQWRFSDLNHPYMFAFDDVRFDQHGFPHQK